ncbi:MAG: helix-turn-helix transcriptional regulator [Pseudomonadota bacterium]
MQIDEKYNEFLLQVHSSSRELEPLDFQRQTLQQLRWMLDFDFAIWGAGDGVERHVHTATILDQDQRLFDTWEPVKHEDPFANLVIGNTGRTWALADLPAPALETRAYNEHWRRYDAVQMLSTMEVEEQTGLHIFITLCRDNERVLFTDRQRRFKSMLTRHLFLAARHNEQFALQRKKQAGGVAIIDWRGIVHSAIAPFTDLVAQEWGADARRKLPLSGGDFIKGTYSGRHVQFSFMPLGDRFIARAEACPPFDKLTPREREIAYYYGRGLSNKEVSETLGISPHTVRKYLQGIYQKLGVRDKSSLAVLCRNG